MLGTTAQARFWKKVMKTEECWIWCGAANSRGYGQFGVQCGGRSVSTSTHRISYELANGPIPAGMVVMHSCHLRRCIRPDHLSVGTADLNNADTFDAGRFRWADRVRCTCRLRPTEATDARRLLAVGVAPRLVAKWFRLSAQEVRRLPHFRTDTAAWEALRGECPRDNPAKAVG